MRERISDWLWDRRLMPWQLKIRLLPRPRFSYQEVRIIDHPGYPPDWEPCVETTRSCSYYYTPLGVWLHPRKMRRVQREVDELLRESA